VERFEKVVDFIEKASKLELITPKPERKKKKKKRKKRLCSSYSGFVSCYFIHIKQ